MRRRRANRRRYQFFHIWRGSIIGRRSIPELGHHRRSPAPPLAQLDERAAGKKHREPNVPRIDDEHHNRSSSSSHKKTRRRDGVCVCFFLIRERGGAEFVWRIFESAQKMFDLLKKEERETTTTTTTRRWWCHKYYLLIVTILLST